jgi:hypothetical protein
MKLAIHCRPLDRQLQISDRSPGERFHFAREEAGILISEDCWLLIAETLVAPDLLGYRRTRGRADASGGCLEKG